MWGETSQNPMMVSLGYKGRFSPSIYYSCPTNDLENNLLQHQLGLLFVNLSSGSASCVSAAPAGAVVSKFE
jgi:hypothetical protein